MGGPMTLFSGLMICQNGSPNAGKHFTFVYQFIIKGIVKDTNENLMER
jgi:hypothetical protein